MVHTTRWDAAAHIKTREDVAACIEAALEEGDPALVAAILRDISRSQGLNAVAEHAGVAPEVIRALLEPDGDPPISKFMDLLRLLDLRLSVVRDQTM
jgi:probable addiction module antidote protein